MDNKWEKSCCFFGHRKIEETSELTKRLKNVIENLIVKNNVNVFLFGSKSEFNSLCLNVVTELKEKYPQIIRIYVRAEYEIINDSYQNYLLKSYEKTYYPEKIKGAGKASYIKRNYEMIDKSKYCVVYYDEYYAPPRGKSGTKIAYYYAVKEKREIINVYK